MKRVFCALVLIAASYAHAEDLNDYLSNRAKVLAAEMVNQKAQQNQTASKQTTAPAQTSNDTLLDESSAADLVSAAFTIATTNGGSEQAVSGGSATLYALAAAIRGIDPMAPANYNAASSTALRRFSLSVGTASADGNAQTKTYQLKWKFVDNRLPTPAELTSTEADNAIANERMNEAVGRVAEFLATALSQEDLDAIVKASTADLTDADDSQEELEEANITSWDKVLTDKQKIKIDEILGTAVVAVHALDQKTSMLIEKVRSRSQAAFAVTLKEPDTGSETCVGEFIYDKGITGSSMYLTANIGAEFTRKDGGGYDNVYRGALRARWEMVQASTGKRGMYFDLTGEAKHTSAKSDWKAQAKFTFPISGGVDLPISVTWANRTDLIDEKRLVGHIGFTLDLSKLMEAIKPH